jgi:hypothetical protein
MQLRAVVVHPRSIQLRPVVEKVAQRQLCFWVRAKFIAYYYYSTSVLYQYLFMGS